MNERTDRWIKEEDGERTSRLDYALICHLQGQRKLPLLPPLLDFFPSNGCTIPVINWEGCYYYDILTTADLMDGALDTERKQTNNQKQIVPISLRTRIRDARWTYYHSFLIKRCWAKKSEALH